jgi:hypothetical protein
VTKQKHLRASISIEQCWGLGYLFSVLASFTLERLVRLTLRILVEQEQLPQIVQREMAFGIFFFIHHCRGQSLFVGLPLKYLFFDSAGRNETIDKALEMRISKSESLVNV